jgi:THO complex subunit 7
MPPKKAAELVITPEEEEVLNQLLVEQMATLKPGVDYPLKRVANGLGAVIDALNAGESTDEALEHFLTELDVYAFNMSRYTTVVAGNRAQQIEYDEEEEALEAKTAELKNENVELRGKLRETVKERAFRAARDEAARACRELPSREASAEAIEALKRSIAEASVEQSQINDEINAKSADFALLFKVIDGLS